MNGYLTADSSELLNALSMDAIYRSIELTTGVRRIY